MEAFYMLSQFDSLVYAHYDEVMAERIDNTVYELRTRKGMTQGALADELAVSRQTVIAIEKGNYTPSVLLALKIAQVFNKKVEDIFTIS